MKNRSALKQLKNLQMALKEANNTLCLKNSAYDYTIGPMEKAIVKTYIQIAVQPGHYGRVGEFFTH